MTTTTTTLADHAANPPGYHPGDTFTLWCREWDDRVVHGSGTVGPEYSYDGGLVTLPGGMFARRLRDSLDQAKGTHRPISRIEIRHDRETIATLTEAQAWDLVAEAGPWTVVRCSPLDETRSVHMTRALADADARAALADGTTDLVVVKDCLDRHVWSDYAPAPTHHEPTVPERVAAIADLIAARPNADQENDDILTDLLADLMHWSSINDVNWDGALAAAYRILAIE